MPKLLTYKEKIEDGIDTAEAAADGSFDSKFPPETMQGGYYSAFKENVEENSIKNIRELSRLTYGRIISKWGGPSKELAAYSDFTRSFRNVSIGELVDVWQAFQSGDPLEITDELLDMVQQTWKIIGTTGDLYGSVPIIGIFVSLAQSLISTAKTTRKALTEISYPIEDVKMEYVRENDQKIANNILDALSGSDWTQVFSPPVFTIWGGHGDARASAIHHANVKWGGGAGQGVVLTLQGGAGFPKHIPTGFGLHPQTARIPIAWQYHTGDPQKKKTRDKWTYKKGLKARVDSFEEFHPATQQLSLLLWQRVMKNSPEIYRIDAPGIRASWSLYFKGMEEYLTRKSDDFGLLKTPEYVRPMTRGVIERILSPEYWGNDNAIKKSRTVNTADGLIIYWKVLGKEVPFSYYSDPAKIQTKGIGGEYYDYKWRQSSKSGTPGEAITGGERTYGFIGPRLTARGLTEFIIDQSLKTRQWNYLNTLTVAYLTPDMPAFRNWPELLAKFHKNREILLNHVARIWIDLDLVPESSWKQKLLNSLKGVPPGMKYTLPVAKIKSAATGGDAVIPDKEDPSGNPIPLIPQMKMVKKPDGGTTSGSGGAGIAVAAAAGLGLMMMRGKK